MGKGPRFTEQARAAAAEARRRRAVMKVENKNNLEVFALRLGNRFSWTIRQFGGVEIATSDESFTSAAAARAAGKAALATLQLSIPYPHSHTSATDSEMLSML